MSCNCNVNGLAMDLNEKLSRLWENAHKKAGCPIDCTSGVTTLCFSSLPSSLRTILLRTIELNYGLFFLYLCFDNFICKTLDASFLILLGGNQRARLQADVTEKEIKTGRSTGVDPFSTRAK